MRKDNIKIALLSPIDLTFFKKYIKEKIPKKFIDLGSGPSINSLGEELINKGHKLLIVSIRLSIVETPSITSLESIIFPCCPLTLLV